MGRSTVQTSPSAGAAATAPPADRLRAAAAGLTRLSPAAVAVGLALAAGVAVRIWVLSSPLGSLDADEAITGLIARHALDGEFYVLYWLSYYGGSQEALLTAAVFAVFGSSVLALKLTTLSLFTAAGALVWAVGRRTVGQRAAWLGTALFWVSPAYFVWWTTKARAYYGVGLICELLVLLLVLRLRARDSRADAVMLGFTLGFGAWASLQFLLVALPALAWLAWRRPAAYRLAWLALPALAVGAAPWLAWNARNGWVGILPRSEVGSDTTYLDRLVDLFQFVLPTWLGLRVPFSLEWIGGQRVGIALLALALVGFGWLLVRRPRGLELLLVVAASFPFLYAATSFTYLIVEPRYLVFFAPVTALLLGWAASRSAPSLLLVPLAAALSILGLVRMEQAKGWAPSPPDLGPVLRVLERERADRVLADYWIAYRISFESGERIIATSTSFVRYAPHDRLVRSHPHPARVYIWGRTAEDRARAQLEANGFRRYRAGDYVVFVHRDDR
jgi:4-amino-4-deoxy-L-arabinose transferase-like glycosyltransferase